MIIYNFFKALFTHLKYRKILKEVYKNENLLENLSKLFGTNFRIDWIGRIYTVINPNLTPDGKYDANAQIYEYGEDGFRNDVYIERQIMHKLNIAKQYINTNGLFEIMTYKINKLDEWGNYLFIIQPISLLELLKKTKHLLILLLSLAVVATGLFIFL